MSSSSPREAPQVQFLADTKGLSPYRLVDAKGQALPLLNRFLDASALRALSPRTLRTYAYALKTAWSWILSRSLTLEELTEVHLYDYVDYLNQNHPGPSPAAPTSLNLRLSVLRALYRFHLAKDIPYRLGSEPPPIRRRSPSSSIAFPQRLPSQRPRLRVKQPKRLIVPLHQEEIARYTSTLTTWRDRTIVFLMLFQGLRSRELLCMRLRDVDPQSQRLRVLGKGRRERVLPLTSPTTGALEAYLQIERPLTQHDFLFVLLKGACRGQPMSPSGLRSLFRYHRKLARLPQANPHRFRHTFAADMVRAGVSLPILMRLMGHSQLEMTLRYIHLSDSDVHQEFRKALRRRNDPDDRTPAG